MPCDGCGRDVYPLHYYPTKVARVTHKLRHGQWLCDRCLEKLMPIEIPERLREELRPLEPRFIKLAKRSKRPIQKNWPRNRLRADSSELRSWLREGGNYGVVGGDGLVILDADTPEVKGIANDKLPVTFTVQSPGSLGWHCYFLCDLPRPIRLRDRDGENVGDVQGAGKQVVGPTCVHPNGKRYRIVRDIPLARVTEEQLLEALGAYAVRPNRIEAFVRQARRERAVAEFGILDVVSPAGLRRQGQEFYGPHPIHGSTTGRNFWVNPRKDAWFCFRHMVGGGPLSWLAVREGIIRCEEATPGALRGDLKKKVIEKAEELGLIKTEHADYIRERRKYGYSVIYGDDL